MKIHYYLLLISLVNSQETEGTIFQAMNDSLTESEAAQQASNVEPKEELASAPPVDPLASISLEELQDQNEELKSEQKTLMKLLQDSQAKLEKYQSAYSAPQPQIEKQISDTETYQASVEAERMALQQSQLAAELKIVEEEEDDDSRDLSLSLIFIVGIGFVFLFMHGLKTVMGFSLEKFLNPAFHSLFVDLTILLVICSAVSLCQYLEVFKDETIDYEMITLGVAIFTLFWLIHGLWLIMAAQSFSKNWYRHEKECQEMRNLTHLFHDAQIDLASGHVPRNLKSIYQNFHYAIMKQLFICPTFIPPVTESYLRTDFNFPEYLSRGLAQILNQVFQINWLGYTFTIFAMLGWRILLLAGEFKQFIALWVFPGSTLLITVIVMLKLKGIYNDLVPVPTDQIMMNLPKDNFGRSPEMNEELIPRPNYLKGSLIGKEGTSFCGSIYHPLKLTWAYIIGSTFPNRHELLFWFDRYGVEFIVALLQGISVTLNLWVTVVILFYIDMLYDKWDWYGILMSSFCFVLWAILALYMVPEIIRMLALVSKIEMKKDRKLIEDVIENEKTEKARVVMRIYRQLKMIYREKYKEKEDKIDLVIKKNALEAFNLCKDKESQTVSMFELEDLIALSGVKLNEDELRLFAKECRPKNLSEFDENEFCRGVQSLFASRKLRPEHIVKTVLENFFEEAAGKKVKDVNLDDLREFFKHFWWHFTDDDIQDFLWETRFTLGDVGTVQITELAAMVRNTIKDYAR